MSRSGSMLCRAVRVRATDITRSSGETAQTDDAVDIQTSVSFSTLRMVGSCATTAPFSAPTLVPTTRSGRIPASKRPRSMPTALSPRTPPPPSTKATSCPSPAAESAVTRGDSAKPRFPRELSVGGWAAQPLGPAALLLGVDAPLPRAEARPGRAPRPRRRSDRVCQQRRQPGAGGVAVAPLRPVLAGHHDEDAVGQPVREAIEGAGALGGVQGDRR